MSAVERLAAAHAKWLDDFSLPNRFVDGVLDADPDLAQDIADGEALRRLREAVAGRWFIHIHERTEEYGGDYVVSMESFDPLGGWLRTYEAANGPTIAAAADACREALEALP